MPRNRVVIIAGPTASGKSSFAIDLALKLNGVIVNADSMQVYKDMPIISAVPTREDKEKAEHRLYEIYDPSFRGNVVDWLNLAIKEIRDIWSKGKLPLVVGGTGLYIENLMKGTTPIPAMPDAIRQKVQKMIEEEGVVSVHGKLAEVDPKSGQKINANDMTRIKRAYEVFLHTGEPMSVWQKKPLIQNLSEANFFTIKLCPSTQELDELSYARFDKMVELGVIDEVERLYKRKLDPSLPAMKALGVPELIEYFKGKTNVYLAVQNAKLHTRQYAKRQRTWFKNRLPADFEYKKCYKGDFPDEMLDILKKI